MKQKPTVHYSTAGVSSPRGFLSAGIACGIKKSGDRDLAMVYSEAPCVWGGTFTTNLAKAAPVLFDLELIGKKVRGVVLNSGNANAATGKLGLENARRISHLADLETRAKRGSSAKESFLICSTGRIGIQLPMAKVRAGIQKASRALTRHDEATARAIMTSDTFPKRMAARIHVGGRVIHIGGMSKGAGMIKPRMSSQGKGAALHATMLCVLTTDASLPRPLLQHCLNEAVAQSFNRISVDGDMSTNDTVLILANGSAGHPTLRKGSKELKIFQRTLNEITRTLALMIVQDGEGISRVVTLRIKGASSAKDAELAIRAVSQSSLVKCAWFGGDPNWGRLWCALGYSGAQFDPDRFRVLYDDILLVSNGLQQDKNVKKARKVAKKNSFMVTCDLGKGKYESMLYTTDLTEKYVEFNKGE